MIRTVALRGLAVVISVALVWWLVTDARWAGVGERLRRIDVRALIFVASLFAASYAMRGARIHGEFRDELDGSKGAHDYLRILRLTLVHNALVNVLPFRSGEVAFPVLLARWFGIGSGRAVVSLLWLRAQDAIVVLALAALVWPAVPIAWRVLALAAIVGGALMVPAWARRHRGAAASGSTMLVRFGGLLERSTRRAKAGWLWTVGNWSAKLIAEAWLVELALGPDARVSTATAALGAIGAELAAILPVQGVAGFGTFEAGGAALLRTQGVALQTGLEAVLVLHAVVLSFALVAGALAALLLPGPQPAPAVLP
jgi:uncharacterized membrane protein YbhN (UPF0104 family)